MNPRAGDTVTSTKSSTTTKTTGVRATGGTGGTGGRSLLTRPSDSALNAVSRKRRQQPEQPEPSVPLHPEANPPPDKFQRPPDAFAGAAHKSRFGDFFSNIASRFRGPKIQDAPNSHADVEDQQVKNEVASKSLECIEKAIVSMPNTNNISKRRKIDPTREISKIDSDLYTKTAGNTEIPNFEQVKSKQELPLVEPIKNDDCIQKTDSNVKGVEAEQLNSNGATLQDQQRRDLEHTCKKFVNDMCNEVWRSEAKTKAVDNVDKDVRLSKKRDFAEDSAEKAKSSLVDEEKVSRSLSRSSHNQRRDEVVRLRTSIQWLEENARQLREELAAVRSELHEERRASRIIRREYEAAMRETKNTEATKYGAIISDLKTRLSQSPSRSTMESSPSSSKTDLLKNENHRREVAALKKRLTVAETTIQKLKSSSLDRDRTKKSDKENESNKIGSLEMRKLQMEIQSLRAANKSLEEKLRIAEESARARAAELRTQHENHEAEMSSLQKVLRSDTIKLIEEIQSKNRIIEKLEKMANECAQANEKLRAKEDETMRKLRESERNHQIRLTPRIEEKIHHDDRVVDLCKVDCELDEAVTELDRLRELAIEQQEVIEVLRQTVKEKERKLEQLSNKRRKEEFYKQWLELEPVAEVEDEEEHQHEEGDSALSSAPSSLSPQPGNGGFHAHGNGVSREAYDNLLFEIEELQTKLLEEQQELSHAKTQVRDLEKALLQETRGSQNSRRTLSEKLRKAEEREASLVAEISELREQNELLEFRVLELEESPISRETPDPADSGIVSPEPIHIYKASKHRDRAVATVMPYTSTYSHPQESQESHEPQKAPLSLEESGIFEEDVEGEVSSAAQLAPQSSGESAPTESPAGELLQEVQRLQELRARIQERGAKIPALAATSDRRSELEATAFDAELVSELRERVRLLEERLGAREAERRESKMREEELLDENYRLTERTYCLEAELKNLAESKRAVADVETMTEEKLDEPEAAKLDQRSEYVSENQPCSECTELWKDCDARVRQLARTEFCLRQQIASLEQREGAFFETLRQADATWANLEADYEAKLREMTDRLSGQIELNRALFEHLTRLNRMADDTYDPPQAAIDANPSTTTARNEAPIKATSEAMELDGDLPIARPEIVQESRADAATTDVVDAIESTCNWQTASPSSSRDPPIDSDKLSTISRTRIKMTQAENHDEVDMKVLAIKAAEPPTEVATEAKEDNLVQPSINENAVAAETEPEPEALVDIDRALDRTLDRASSDKKVSRLRGSLRRLATARGSDALSQWSERRRAVSFERNVIGSAQRTHRLTVYQEICV